MKPQPKALRSPQTTRIFGLYCINITNKFVTINLLCISVFISSLFGALDWALASVIMIAGVSFSTLFGTYLYSKHFIKGIIRRLIFSFGVLAMGYVFYKVGEYLNQNVYDGLITLSVIGYILFATALLHYLGKKSH